MSSRHNSNSGHLKLVPTGIQTLDKLLGGGIRTPPDSGALGVVFGAAGTGKSILAMQLCCSFVLKRLITTADRPCTALYLTTDSAAEAISKIDRFERFTWNFRRELNIDHLKEDRFRLRLVEPGATLNGLLNPGQESSSSVCVCSIPPSREPQKEALENIFDIAAAVANRIHEEPHESLRPSDRLLICVDSANLIQDEALRLAMADRGGEGESVGKKAEEGPAGVLPGRESTWRTRTFYDVLRRDWSSYGVNTFLFFEEEAADPSDPKGSEIPRMAQAYAADLVIHLGLETYPPGYRQRFLEIVKARNQYYQRGRHDFSIVSFDGGDRYFPERRDEASSEASPNKLHIGVTIYPAVTVQLQWLAQDKQETGHEQTEDRRRCGLGIAELDGQILRADPKVRALPNGAPERGYIRRGSSSVLVSDLDVKATQIALHFALQRNQRALYISFFHDEVALRGIIRRFDPIADLFKEQEDHYRLLYFPPEYIRGAKLMRDIRVFLDRFTDCMEAPPTVVVIDNVFELRCKYPLLGDVQHFLSALIELFRARGVTSLTVDMVETGEGRNPIEASKVAGLADNVFLLRHVELESRPRHAFSVLKLTELRVPENPWDLDEKPSGSERSVLVARDTFDLYRNVLSGRPEPVPVQLTLYNDEKDSPFHRYLEGQRKALQQSFGKQGIKVELYGPEEYPQVQAILTRAAPRERAGCHLVALDEFWLEQLMKYDALEEIGIFIEELSQDSQEEKEMDEFKDRTQYVSAAHDMVLFRRRENRQGEDLKRWHRCWFAIPARNNAGILCCAPGTVKTFLESCDGNETTDRMRAWLEGPTRIHWKDLVTVKPAFQDWNPKTNGKPHVFFAFCMDQLESCVSFFLELAMSFGNRAELVTEDGVLQVESIPPDSLRVLLELLDEEDVQRLADGVFRPSSEEPAALFSRQWMSTLGCLRAREAAPAPMNPDYFRALEPFELPISRNSNHPTPVSGTWYVGILKGSTAVKAGVKVILQFTSVANEIYKLNHYIGLPVRKHFYTRSEEGRAFRLPYQDRYAKLAEIQGSLIGDPENQEAVDKYRNEILMGDCPFYRVLITDYQHVAPILWRLMVNVGKEYVAWGCDWAKAWPGVDRARKQAQLEYQALMAARRH